MGFHKGSFKITSKSKGFIEKTGWIDETGTYGFYSFRRPSGNTFLWVATDLSSGLRITTAKTRKECVEWIEKNLDLINYKKKQNEYRIAVERLNKYEAN